MTTFADNLKRLRRAAGLTQTKLAELGGLKQGQVSLYETGSDIPELPSLLKLATGLRVTLEDLVEGLDVRFDLVYQELQASITIPDEPAQPERTLQPLGAIPPVLHGEELDPANQADELDRLIAGLVRVAQNIRPGGSSAVARRGGPDVPEGTRTGHAAARRKPAPKTRKDRSAAKR